MTVELSEDVVRALRRGDVIRIEVSISARYEGGRLRIDADLLAPEALGKQGCTDIVVDAVAKLVSRMESQ